MYYQDIGGTLINNFLRGDSAIDLTFDEMTKEFDKSLHVNNK